MSFQGLSRSQPPFCTGQGSPTTGDHCCYVEGQTCPLLRIDDPRDTRPDARYSCGLVLDLQAQFPNFDLGRIWDRVHRHPLFAQIKAKWDQHGVTYCGAFVGVTNPDGTITGQCCFEGYLFAADGTVISGPGG